MICEEVNQINLVNYLRYEGHQPKKINGNDHWYYSSFRDERTPSFKINNAKNVWYDHGLGKGGTLVDFVTEFYNCNVSVALQKISLFQTQNISTNNFSRPRFHLHENSMINHEDAKETGIRIIAAKQPIEDLMLCRYLKQRNITKKIADRWCHEVHFSFANNEKIYKAIGFKNNAGGYELRNEFFKGSSAPKYISYLDNKAKNIAVFEGFFDFLSYQFIYQNQEQQLSNLPDGHTGFLVLNSLSFFERSLILMEKHERIQLYLVNP